ncbi:hypothetical protein [Proteus mirabilis]|nr:hypothetical protein [Proteus mirabilis]MDF7233780.1 hypothetical protein [Proteus mirabilis]
MKKYSLYGINNLSTVEALEPPFQATVSCHSVYSWRSSECRPRGKK